MDAYVARQPIFDTEKSIFGYELLFRDSMSNMMPDIDGDTATSQLLSSSFFTIGLDELTNGKYVFINFTGNLLLRRFPLIFPPELTVVEILEDIQPTKKMAEAIYEIKNYGFTIALDDFVYEDKFLPFIRLADIIKIDFRLTPIDEIRNCMALLPGSGVRYLAEKIETLGEFEQAKEMGFELFQGYFFCRPEIVPGKEISSAQINLLQIIAEVNNPEFDFSRIEEFLTRDIGITFKLMSYINSAFFGRRQKVSSVKQALLLLGGEEIRRFTSLMSMTKLATDKPEELIRLSCIRAKFCELAGASSALNIDSGAFFTMGMFSLIDAILDKKMADIMNMLPFPPEIVNALVHGEGPMANHLKFAEHYERGDWEAVKESAGMLGIDETTLPEIFITSIRWADFLTRTE